MDNIELAHEPQDIETKLNQLLNNTTASAKATVTLELTLDQVLTREVVEDMISRSRRKPGLWLGQAGSVSLAFHACESLPDFIKTEKGDVEKAFGELDPSTEVLIVFSSPFPIDTKDEGKTRRKQARAVLARKPRMNVLLDVLWE